MLIGNCGKCYAKHDFLLLNMVLIVTHNRMPCWLLHRISYSGFAKTFCPSLVILSDILGFRQSFYNENGRQTWLLCQTFCLPIQELLVRQFQNLSDMSDVTNRFREACLFRMERHHSKLLIDYYSESLCYNTPSHNEYLAFGDPPINM